MNGMAAVSLGSQDSIPGIRGKSSEPGARQLSRHGCRRKSERHAEALVAQLAAFAVRIDENPPQLIQHRSCLSRGPGSSTQAPTLGGQGQGISQLRERLVQLQEKEKELQRATVAQCLKGCHLGV
jgi:hypothetical protein